jgi:hypothetical protein
LQGKKKYNNKKRFDLTGKKQKNDEITIFFFCKNHLKNSNKKIKIKSDRRKYLLVVKLKKS